MDPRDKVKLALWIKNQLILCIYLCLKKAYVQFSISGKTLTINIQYNGFTFVNNNTFIYIESKIEL